MEVRLKEKIPGVFWPVHQAIRRSEVTEVVAKGGRGSGKSSYLSMELVWQLLRHPDCHAVVLRKVGGTLRNSVYNQIVWAIGELGCAGYFRCTVSPMECTYLPTGQKINSPFRTNSSGGQLEEETIRTSTAIGCVLPNGMTCFS